MTKSVARAVLAAGFLAGTFALAAPASAYCDPTFYELTGRCNACYLADPAYYKATGRHLDCLA